MERTGAKDYWTLRRSGALSYETSQYVPRYAALVIIYRNRRLSGLAGEINPPRLMITEKVTVTAPLNLNSLCTICYLNPEIIRIYNPALKTDIIPSYSGTYTLRIPEESVKYWNLYF